MPRIAEPKTTLAKPEEGKPTADQPSEVPVAVAPAVDTPAAVTPIVDTPVAEMPIVNAQEPIAKPHTQPVEQAPEQAIKITESAPPPVEQTISPVQETRAKTPSPQIRRRAAIKMPPGR